MANGDNTTGPTGQFMGDEALDQLAEIAAMSGFDPEVEADVRNAIMGGGQPSNPVASGPGAQTQAAPQQPQPQPQPLPQQGQQGQQGQQPQPQSQPQSPIAGQQAPSEGNVPVQDFLRPQSMVGNRQVGEELPGSAPNVSETASGMENRVGVMNNVPADQGELPGAGGGGGGSQPSPQAQTGGGSSDFAGVRANVPSQDMNRSQVNTEKLGQALSALAELNTEPPPSPPPASVGAAGQVEPFLLPLFQQPLTTRGGGR